MLRLEVEKSDRSKRRRSRSARASLQNPCEWELGMMQERAWPR